MKSLILKKVICQMQIISIALIAATSPLIYVCENIVG
jgi:hypothetical protein